MTSYRTERTSPRARGGPRPALWAVLAALLAGLLGLGAPPPPPRTPVPESPPRSRPHRVRSHLPRNIPHRFRRGRPRPRPLRLTIDRENPLLITQLNIGHNFGENKGFRRDLNDGWSIRQAWAGLPDELKGHTAFVLHPGHNQWADGSPATARRWAEDNLAEGRDLGIPMFVLWGESPTRPSDRFAWIEKLYRTYPNFVGTAVSELKNTLNDLPQALELAHRYGGFHVLGSLEEANTLGSKLEDPRFFASVRPYAQNFILDPKNMHENMDTATAQAVGLWLSGVVGNWGPYFDGYTFYGCGIFGQGPVSNRGERCSRSAPESIYGMTMLDQWQNGATVFHLENQLDVPAADSRYSAVFYQSVLPAMRHMLAHSGPTKEQVVAATPVAFSEAAGTISSLPDTVQARNLRTTFYDLYEKVPDALGRQGLWYYPRSSGRYGLIPRLPKLADESVVRQFPTVLTAADDRDLVAGDAKRAFFEARYPTVSRGDAFVQHRNGSWLVYNSRYMDNVRQDASFDLAGPDFTQVDLPDLTPHTYALVAQGPGKLSMLFDNYRTDRTKDLLRDGGSRDMEFIDGYARYAYLPRPADDEMRTTTVRVHAKKPPVLTISGYDGHYSHQQQWNENTGVYTLTLRHNGVVNVDLTTGPTTDGWRRLAPESEQIRSDAEATEVVFDGTSVQWSAGQRSKGTARVLIDGTVYDDRLDLARAAQQQPFRATGLPGGPHTLRIEGAQVRTGSVHYVPSTEQMLPDVESADFSYASAEDDQDTVYGSDKWRVSKGKLELLPYTFPFFGDVTAYNTGVRADDVVYEAKMTLRKGTSGALLIRGDEKKKAGYLLRLDPNRVGEGERAPATTGDVQLVLDHSTTLAVNTDVDLVTGRQYSVRFQAVGDRIQAWLDGESVIDHTITAAQRRPTGYTGVRIGQRNGGGLDDTVLVDDVRVSRPDGTELYRSDFADWNAAKSWRTESALVFGAGDTRSDFSFPWRWNRTSGTWRVVNTDAFTGGDTGYFTGTAAADEARVTAGATASWSRKDTGYLFSSALRVEEGSGAGLLLRVQDGGDMYAVRLDAAEGRVTFDRREGGRWTTLARAGVPGGVDTGAWHVVQVRARGELFSVTVDGKDVLTARDGALTGGGVGYWLPGGAVASFDDARVAALPGTPATGPVGTEIVRRDGTQGRHITGYDVVGVKTAKDSAPELPRRVTALYSDGSRGEVAVNWPAAPAEKLAVATTPYADGQSRGRFTVAGRVDGTELTVAVDVTVMPKLAQPLRTTLVYDPEQPVLPAQTFTDVRFDAGGGVTFARQVYVRWDQAVTVSPDGPHRQVLTGTVGDHPWEKATAEVTLGG